MFHYVKVGRIEHLIISSSPCPDSFVQLPNELGLILLAGEINSDRALNPSLTHLRGPHVISHVLLQMPRSEDTGCSALSLLI